MAAGWRKTTATALLIVGFLARACPVSAGFEKAKSCPDGTKTQMDFSAVQKTWLQTGSLSVTLLDSKDGCLLEKDALFKTRVKGGRLVVRKETKPKGRVCEAAVTEVPAPVNQLFVSCVEDKMAASDELGALMAAANATLQSRRIGRTMGGFTPTTPKPSSGFLKATELQAEGALTTFESKLPPTTSPKLKPVTKKYAPTETILSTAKIIPTPTVLSTEIKVLPTSLPTTVATMTVPPLSTVVPLITDRPTTERETVTTPPPTTSAPSTPPPPTATEASSTPPPPTTTEEPPTTQPPTTSERPTEHPPPAPPEASKPAVTATTKSPLLEEDAERFGAKSGTPPSPELTHEESQDTTMLMLKQNLPYVIGGAVGVFVLILLIITIVALSKRRKKKVSREDPIALGSANYRRQQDDLDSHDQDHVNIMMYSADELEEAPHHNDLEERILKPGGPSSTPATPRCLRDKNFD
ncbi:mucin-5B-like [Penaeus monodon]|uniref:mucin-5B-like n=1 Tax=Penaeus monodon TaxID=6687 RepID=UPI0018A6F427|nr:mucin-5B-like [Penaeus monodon]